MTSKRGRKFHGQASDANERGDFLDALKFTEEAFLAYQEDGDRFGLCDVLAQRSIILRLLQEKTSDKSFLILAKHEAMAGVEIARSFEQKDMIILPLFRLGQVQDDLGEFGEAVKSYKEAIEIFGTNPPETHNRKGVLADMQIRLAVAEYKAGDELALSRVLIGIEDLEKSGEKEVSKYNYDVWLSGAHMKIAEMLKATDMDLAKKHLNKAKKIIGGNSDLKLRKGQWEKLNESF